MLILCQECELQISDKAITCPHCGYPLKPDRIKNIYRKSNKRKRLPNGFGQIVKLNNTKLRNPYRAMATVGKTTTGRPICKILKPQGYFATYNDAYMALVEYNKNPYDLNKGITVSQLYDKWFVEYSKTLTNDSSIRNIKSAWSYCSSLYNMRASDVRARHIKGCMEDGTAIVKGKEKSASAGTKSRIKSMFNLMFDYALEYEIIDKNYSRTFNLSDEIIQECENSRVGHLTFTDEEIETLWRNIDNIKYIDVLLIQCYSGWRPQELGLIKLENVDLDNWIFSGGMKTEAGKDRIVPIHSKIREIVKRKYKEAQELGSEYLLNCTDSSTHTNSIKLTYDKYQQRFKKIVAALNLDSNHKAHDGRKHFITLAKKYKVDEYAIKYIVGHTISDITKKVYTQRDINWLQEEIEKIK